METAESVFFSTERFSNSLNNFNNNNNNNLQNRNNNYRQNNNHFYNKDTTIIINFLDICTIIMIVIDNGIQDSTKTST